MAIVVVTVSLLCRGQVSSAPRWRTRGDVAPGRVTGRRRTRDLTQAESRARLRRRPGRRDTGGRLPARVGGAGLPDAVGPPGGVLDASHGARPARLALGPGPP